MLSIESGRPSYFSLRNKLSACFASLMRGCRKRKLVARRSARVGELLEDRVMLTIFTVNSLADGIGVGGSGITTLREALTAANTNASVDGSLAGDANGDIIYFDTALFGSGGTITLDAALGDLLISDDVQIDGLTGTVGSTDVTISGANASRIFSVNTTAAPGGANVQLLGLTLMNGNGTGNVSANDGRGGALYIGSTNGSVILKDVTIDGSTASGPAASDGGGGIYNSGARLALTNTTLSNNVANGTSGSGGGILSVAGLVTARDSMFIGNMANRAGGGIELVDGNLDTTNSTFDSNVAGPMGTANPGNGGAFHVTGNSSQIFINGGTITNNVAGREGGGLWNQAGSTMTVRNGTVISGNVAHGDAADDGGGGIFNNGGAVVVLDSMITMNDATGAAGSGGGVFSTDGTVRIERSSVTGNSAVRAGGGVEIVEGVFTGNSINLDSNDASGSMSAPGNGGGLHVTGAATVYVSGGTVAGNTAALEGGGLWNGTGIMIVRSGALIDANVASGHASHDGGGGIFNNGGRLAISNSTITNNVADGAAGSGGGILSTAGLVTALNTSVSSNTANRAGGGIELINGNFETTDSLFDGNVAGPMGSAAPGNGGAFHLTGNSSSIVFSNADITNNTAAREGGGLWNQSGSQMLVRAGSTISGNVAQGDAADDGGGGIFNNGGTLTVLDSAVDFNDATGTAGSGGGIFSTAGRVRVDRSSISGNSAVRAGGGVEIVTGAFSTLSSNLDDNDALGGTAPGNGGALHVTGLADVFITGGTVSDNTAALEGGGLWNGPGSMTVRNAVMVTNNLAGGDAADDGGGGLFNNGGTLRVLDSTISNNSAVGAAGSGGGIFTTGGDVTIRNSQVEFNAANRAGGGLEIVDGTIQISNSNFITNDANGGAPGAPGNGGGLHVSGMANTTVTGGSFFNNYAAEEGGGLWNQVGSTLSVAGTLIFSNFADGSGPDQGGGGIFNAGGTVNITNATIDSNEAIGTSGSGGGILNDVGGTVNVTGTMIINNIASRAGGGIEDNSGAGLGIVLTNVNLDGNNAGAAPDAIGTPGNGGGLHVTGPGDVVISGGTVSGNVAGLEGGGLWNGSGTMTINGTTVADNTASGAAADDGGGGIFNNGGTLTVINTTVSGNSADGALGSGGGVFSTDGTVFINNSTISGNDSVRAGGGIEVINGNLIVIDSDLVMNDTLGGGPGAPGNGGAVHISGMTNSTFIGGNVSNNTAAAEGGGLWNQVGSTMTITGTAIDSNTASGAAADQGGGGVFNAGGIVNISNSTITNNVADGTSGSGGGILNDVGGLLNINGAAISNNTANRAGGGIEDNSGSGLGVALRNVMLANNNAGVAPAMAAPGNGGGLHVTGSGDVAIIGGSVTGNVAALEGGGLWNGTGTMTVDGTVIDGNTASGDAANEGGGGIFNAGGTVVLQGGVSVTNNVADGTSGSGGGILNDAGGTLTVHGTLESPVAISGNSANRAGGGIETVGGTVDLTFTNMELNDVAVGAAPGNGGALHISGSGTVSATSSAFDSNSAVEGGALWVSDTGILTVTNSSVTNNSATSLTSGGGGIHVDDAGSGAGNLTVVGSTLSGNSATGFAGGGILFEGGTGTISNSTLSGNAANPALGIGGGLRTLAGSLALDSLTLFNNTGNGIGDQIGISAGASVLATNSIFADTSAGVAEFDAIEGVFSVGSDYNLTSDGGVAGNFPALLNNILATDPDLGALSDNGGPLTASGVATFTHLPNMGSPLVDAGSTGLGIDQRGLSRGAGGNDDIGAVEVQPIVILDAVNFAGQSFSSQNSVFASLFDLDDE